MCLARGRENHREEERQAVFPRAAKHAQEGPGTAIGAYAERLLSAPQPWTRLRHVYRLLGLVRRHAAAAVEQTRRQIPRPGGSSGGRPFGPSPFFHVPRRGWDWQRRRSGSPRGGEACQREGSRDLEVQGRVGVSFSKLMGGVLL
jgi:hypothetical protein